MSNAETPHTPASSTADSAEAASPSGEASGNASPRFGFAPDENAAADQPAETLRPDAPAPDHKTSSVWLPLAGAAIFAGGAVAAVAVLTLIGPAAPGSAGRDEAAAAMNARIAQIETQLRTVAGRPVPASIDPKQLDDMAARLSRIESQMSERLAMVEGAAKSVAADAALANRRIDETAAVARDARSQADAATRNNNADAARADVEALGTRLAAVEKSAKAADAELARRVAMPDDRVGRLAVAALSLRGAVERGDPFGSELAAAKTLGADPKAVSALDAFAEKGLPSASLLAREWSALVPAMQRALGTESESGFIEKLQANAGRLVRIRPVADAPGDDPMTVIGRTEIKTAQNDIAGTLAEWRKLPAPARALADDWARRAQARDAALAAARDIATNAVAALSKTGS